MEESERPYATLTINGFTPPDGVLDLLTKTVRILLAEDVSRRHLPYGNPERITVIGVSFDRRYGQATLQLEETADGHE